MPSRYWILKDKEPVFIEDLEKWTELWKDDASRIVAQTKIGSTFVSTVFLGIDHSFSMNPNEAPLLFETMIFGGKEDQYQNRYSTWWQAESGHNQAVQLAKKTAWWDWTMTICQTVNSAWTKFMWNNYWRKKMMAIIRLGMKRINGHDAN